MLKRIFTKKSFILFFIFVIISFFLNPIQVIAQGDVLLIKQAQDKADKLILEAIKNAELKEEAKREDCRRRIGEQDAECTFQWDDVASLDRMRALVKCQRPFTACMSVPEGGLSEIQIECQKQLYTQDGGKCAQIENIGSTACIDFYSACLEKARWDKKAIADALASTGAAGGTTSGYPVRLTPEEYADLNTPIPYCAFTYEGCRNTDDLVTLMVNIGKMIFSVIGVLAFVMFIYGGFTMILAMGNPEKFKKGMQILVAAITGIIISLSAYLLINFLLTALGVGADFREL